MTQKDYDRDNESKQHDTIDEKILYNSLYELADIWCPNIDANEYKNFFDALKFRFRYEGQKGKHHLLIPKRTFPSPTMSHPTLTRYFCIRCSLRMTFNNSNSLMVVG
jgi:hypothetical protein